MEWIIHLAGIYSNANKVRIKEFYGRGKYKFFFIILDTNLVSIADDCMDDVDNVRLRRKMLQTKDTLQLLQADDHRSPSHEASNGGMR